MDQATRVNLDVTAGERKLFSKSASVEGMRLEGQTIGGRSVEGGYVCRIQ